jgi:hypothetical protein
LNFIWLVEFGYSEEFPMTQITYAQLLHYLKTDFAVSNAAIEQALQQLGQDFHLLPIALWQYGRLTLNQLDQTYDWLAIAYKRQEFSKAFDAIA